jgi:hypothetical protein
MAPKAQVYEYSWIFEYWWFEFSSVHGLTQAILAPEPRQTVETHAGTERTSNLSREEGKENLMQIAFDVMGIRKRPKMRPTWGQHKEAKSRTGAENCVRIN